MNRIKLLVVSLLLTVLSVATLQAGTFKTASFLNGQSILVTNLFQVTNLLSRINTVNTNIGGTIYTNSAGSRVIIGVGTNEYVNLLKTVPLWDISPVNVVRTNQAPGDIEVDGPYYNASIFIRLVGGSGANSAVSFRFIPVPSGFNPTTGKGPDFELQDTDSLVAADLQTISVTATTTTEVHSRTKLDLKKYLGCAGIMLVAVINADADASSSVTVLECTLNYFSP